MSQNVAAAPEPGAAAASQPETKYIAEDVVYRVAERGLEFGTVVASYGGMFGLMDYEGHPMPRSKAGQVRVEWHLDDGKLSVEEKKGLRLADRSLLPGDKVGGVASREEAEERQRGYCRDVQVVSSVQVVGSNGVICGVPGELLEPMEGGFVAGDKCCLGSWIGTIKRVKLKVVSAFPDGSICEMDRDALKFRNDKRNSWSRFAGYNFYKGQTLSGPMSVFKKGEWTHKADEMSRTLEDPEMQTRVVQAVVKGVVTTSLTVQWHCHGFGTGASSQKPSSSVLGEDLKLVKRLNILKNGSLRIGDTKLYRLREGDVLVSRDEWKAVEGAAAPWQPSPEIAKATTSGWMVHAKRRRLASRASSWAASPMAKGQANEPKKPDDKLPAESKKPPPVPGDLVVVEVLSRRSEATVVWQTGDVSENVPSRELQPMYSFHGEEELFCGHFVVRSPGSAGSTGKRNPRVYGVVQSVNRADRTCLVSWFRTYSSGQSPGAGSPTQQGVTEEPVFDLKLHPDFTFECRSFVVPLAASDDEAVGGQVLDVNVDGKVLVRWVDGSKSLCWPQDIYKIEPQAYHGNSDWMAGSLGVTVYVNGPDGVSIPVGGTTPILVGGVGGGNIKDSDLATYLPVVISKIEDSLTSMEATLIKPHSHEGLASEFVLGLHSSCLELDERIGTTFFKLDSIQDLVEGVKILQRVHDQEDALDNQVHGLESQEGIAPGPAAKEGSEGHQDKGEGHKICAKLCSLLKDQLSKYKDEVSKRFGDQPSGTDDSGWAAPVDLIGLLKAAAAAVVTIPSTWQDEALMGMDHGAPEQKSGEQPGGSSNVMVVGGQPHGAAASIFAYVNKLHGAPPQSITLHCKGLKHFLGNQGAAVPEKKSCLEGDAVPQPPGAASTSGSIPMLEEHKDQDLNPNEDQPSGREDSGDAIPSDLLVMEVDQGNVPEQSDGSSNCIMVQPPGGVASTSGDAAVPEKKSCEQSDGNSSCMIAGDEAPPQPPGVGAASTSGSFTMQESAPGQHKFKDVPYNSTNPRNLAKLVGREVQLMQDSLPPGIHVKGYADRMDLYSAMIEGPDKTPYEDGMFFFDIQLSQDYPLNPPSFHYHSYTSDRLNPNLYVDGKVCVSLLGTWEGEGSEQWTVGSNLLQVLISIQGLILVGEPFFNEPGYERLKGTRKGTDSSRLYNEMVLLKTVQGMERLLGNPPEAFKQEVEDQLGRRVDKVFERLETWRGEAQEVDFPLLPASRGFWISMDRAVGSLKKATEKKKA